MTLHDLQGMFNRAMRLAASGKRFLFAFIVLFSCGVLTVFCRALALESGHWLALNFFFLPLFLCSGLLLAMGVMLIRLYHDEIKKRKRSLAQLFARSWTLLVGSAYLSLPFFLCYLLLWILLGIFFLLRDIPHIGETLSAVLAFGPFLLILGSLLLSLGLLLMLFFVSPLIALHADRRLKLFPLFLKRWREDLFTNLLLFCIGLFPLAVTVGFLSLAVYLYEVSTGAMSRGTLQVVLQWFFIMLPFTALMSPAFLFFFHFAAEAHVLQRKR